MGARSWLLRRVMGRLRIDDDVVRHLSTFQRLGETFEVEWPTEMLPVGARTVFRALRTRAAPQIGVDWVWPWWLERQIDPTSPAFVPRGHLPFLTNITARNWTSVGNVRSPWVGIVDPTGLVTPWYDGWSLDWWVGADDRWHFPSRSESVRQRLVDSTPVVETSMTVPGGEAIQRTYGAVVDGEEHLVVEIENASNLPFAVALAVRPYNPEGLAVVERIGLHDGTTVTVDGRPALRLPKAPQRMAGSTFHDGDVAHVVTSGGAGSSLPERLRCEAGLAQAAFLYPLAHKASLRVALPLEPTRRSRRRGVARRRAARHRPLPAALPTAADAARGWASQTQSGMRLGLPAGRLADAVAANRRYLFLFHDGDEITPGPATYHRFWFRDAAYMLGALGRFGHHDAVAQVLAGYSERQRVDGFFFSQRLEWDSNGAALYALADHWRLSRDRGALAEMELAVGRGVQWIERKRHRGEKRRDDPALVGLLPAGVSAEHLGPHDYYYWDDFWCWRGMLDGAELLAALGQPDAASDVRREADAFGADIRRSIELVAARRGDAALPAGPRRGEDPGMIGSLVGCAPLRLLAATDPTMAATAERIRERFCLGDAFFQGISHTGLGTYLTLQLGFVEMEVGDQRALRRLKWMLDAATPTYTWPEAIHPQLSGGCMGDGHHGWAAADFLTFVRNMVVRETGLVSGGDAERGLALCSLFPPEWLGHDVEVHDAPTEHGRLSYGLRWHGDRPALLWELTPHADVTAPVRLTAPGLDPSWSTTERSGDALLNPVAPPSSESSVSIS